MKVPALALPNQKNHSDIAILHDDGSRETASSYFRSLDSTLHLHLMVDSDRQNPASPRLTWQKCTQKVILAATFIYGKDEYGRHTSAAVILNSKQLKKKLPTQISNELDQKTVCDLSDFLSSKEVYIKNEIDKELNSGAVGGEIYLPKYKRDASLVHVKKTNAIGSSIVSLLFRRMLIILTILKHLCQRDKALQAEYRRFPSISKVFPVNEDFNLFYCGGNVNFPLYLYPTSDQNDFFAQLESTKRQPDLNPNLIVALDKSHGSKPLPKEIFYYIYAILHAPIYRGKYAEFLRIDFPRVPFTADRELFAQLTAFGKRLTDLHLLTSPELDPPTCRFEGEGDSVVMRTKAQGFRYAPDECRMYINKTQYFGPISPEIHAYRVGGYQVCDKWLKDRKNRPLELHDIRTYCQMVTALWRTLEIQQELGILYDDVEDNCVLIEE